MVEAGWYHVEGDPPDTVRRWNGEAWIGFPTMLPDASKPTGVYGQTAKPRFTWGRIAKSFLTMLLLVALAGIFAMTASRIYEVEPPPEPVVAGTDVTSDAQPGTDRATAEDPATATDPAGDPDADPATVDDPEAEPTANRLYLDRVIDSLAPFAALIAIGVAINAVTFILWLRSATVIAQVHRFRGDPSRRRIQQRSTASVVLQVFVFGIFAPIFWGLKALLRDSSMGGNKGLFGTLSDTAMASSFNPQTGVSEIGPIKILLWWALWWIPVLVLAGAWIRVWVLGATPQLLHSTVQLTGVLAALEVVSLLCIILTVAQVTIRLSR